MGQQQTWSCLRLLVWVTWCWGKTGIFTRRRLLYCGVVGVKRKPGRGTNGLLMRMEAQI